MTDNSISLLSYFSDGIAKRYIEVNNIKGAFVHKQGPRHYQVLEGNPQDLTGFVCGDFRTKKAAKEKCDKINNRIRELSGEN